MVWQDFVLAIAELALLISIIPQLLLGFKNKQGYITYVTAINAALCLGAIGVAMFTLDLFFTAIVALLNSVAWALFIVQRAMWGGP